MATQISTIPREQMILYKICRGNCSHSTFWSTRSKIIIICTESQFNQTSAWCSHIEDHTNETVYTEVEREVSCDW